MVRDRLAPLAVALLAVLAFGAAATLETAHTHTGLSAATLALGRASGALGAPVR